MKESLKNRENKTTKIENMSESFEEVINDNNNDRDSSPSSSGIEFFPESRVRYTRAQWNKMIKRCKKLLKDAKIYDKLEIFVKYLMANPAMLAGFGIITAILIIPILLFTVFAVMNVAIAFTGFMIIEVVLLLIGLTVLCCILFFIISSVVVTGVSFIVTAYVTYSSFTLVKRKIQSQ